MGLFGFGKKDKDVLDLADRYKKQKAREEQEKMASSERSVASSSPDSDDAVPFPFLGVSQKTASTSSETESDSESIVDLSDHMDKRRKLAKRILDMTTKLEDLSNQIYHLQQRIEVLEKKSDVRRLE